MSQTPFRRALLAASALAALASFAGAAHAADGFKLRFPLSGTLGGEIAAQADNPGFFASAVLTQIDVTKLTDGTGNAFQQVKAGGFATPAPVAGVVRTATYSGIVDVDLKQQQTNANLILGYLSSEKVAGGRVLMVFNLPYTTRLNRQITYSGTTPTLTTLQPALTTPPLPAGTAAAAQAQSQAGFNTAYQAQLAAASTGGSGKVEGAGDAEVSAGWVYRQDDLRVAAGLTVSLPTGKYDAAAPINIGYGNFYTLRPGVAVAYNPTSSWTLGARGSIGFNTRNKDNQVKSGDFSALDLAAAYRSPIGVIGPHVMVVQQFKDDDGGTLGGNRFSATGVGGFFTTLIPGIDAAVNLSYMKMTSAKNALYGSFNQLRASKAF
jgi:hypothetical protein